MAKKRSRKWLFISLTFLLFTSITLSVSIGPITIPFRETMIILLKKIHLPIELQVTEQKWVVITEIRLPRVIVGGIVGAALAVSGVTMQGLFRNPLVEPGFIGVSSGAAQIGRAHA